MPVAVVYQRSATGTSSSFFTTPDRRVGAAARNPLISFKESPLACLMHYSYGKCRLKSGGS
jgi:hypothetical protein